MKHVWTAAALLLVSATALVAQDARFDTRDGLASRRDSLANVLMMLDSDDQRTADAERRIATIEQRLRIGDFRPGDMVSLDVRGRPEYTGNFPVQPDQTLALPGLEPVALGGILYSEATARIRESLATVLRSPVVELTFQLRLAVTGQVAEPGFYDVPGTILLSDLLTLAGGPTQSANLQKIEVRRDGEEYASGEELVTRGLTLDDMGLRSGDVIRIPEERDSFYTLRNVGLFLGTIGTIIALLSL